MSQATKVASIAVNIVETTFKLKAVRGPGRGRGNAKKCSLKGPVLEAHVTFYDGNTKIRFIGASEIGSNELGLPTKKKESSRPLSGDIEALREKCFKHLDSQIDKRFSTWRP